MWPCLCAQSRERDLAESILVVIITSWPCCQKRSKTERIPCSFLGSCLASTVSRHVRFTQKEHINNHKVVAERGCCVVKVNDLVANKVPREWGLLEIFNNPNDEWQWGRFLVTSHQNTKKNNKNPWLEHIAQSRHYSIQQELESQQKIPPSTCRRRRKAQRTTWPRISESNQWCQVFQGFVETPLHKGSSECFPLEVLSIQSSNKVKFGNCQVDRQVFFIVLEALERRLDGQLADNVSILPMRTKKMKKDKEEMNMFWILEHKRSETDGMLNKWTIIKNYFHWATTW